MLEKKIVCKKKYLCSLANFFMMPHMLPEIITIILIASFGMSHSILASQTMKKHIPLNPTHYRLFYVIIGSISFLFVDYVTNIVVNEPDHISMRPLLSPTPQLKLIIMILGVLGGLIVFGVVIQTNPFKFFGLQSEQLNKDLDWTKFYRFSRHPMYFGALLIFVPGLFIMNNLALFLKYFGYSLYFVLGALIEERRLAKTLHGYDSIMFTRGFLFPWRKKHLLVIFSNQRPSFPVLT